jgi:hypothetical protein
LIIGLKINIKVEVVNIHRVQEELRSCLENTQVGAKSLIRISHKCIISLQYSPLMYKWIFKIKHSFETSLNWKIYIKFLKAVFRKLCINFFLASHISYRIMNVSTNIEQKNIFNARTAKVSWFA